MQESEANAGKSIAGNNITSALMIESDNDWDPRIKSQLTNFSEAAVPTTNFVDISGDLRASSIDKTINASPYGNDWDMLWLRTCGAQGDIFYASKDTTATPYLEEHQIRTEQLGVKEFGPGERLLHTHLVTNVHNALCLHAYAVSLRGARKMVKLAEEANSMMDLYIGRKCGDRSLKCIATYPHVFSMAEGKSSMGDVSVLGTEGTGGKTLQYSKRVNAKYIQEGGPMRDWVRKW